MDRDSVGPSVFLSHAHEDKPLARNLAQALDELGVRVWLDEAELRVGDSLVERISDAIAEGDFLVALVSPASLRSEWCRRELALAAQRGIAEKRVTVLPIRVAGAAMPTALADRFWLDAEMKSVSELAERVVRDIKSHHSTPRDGDRSVAHVSPTELGPLLVPAPSSMHRLDEPHQVTPDPQPMFAQRAFVQVENVGDRLAFIKAHRVDPTGAGPISLRPPMAIPPGASRPVELAVSTISPSTRVRSGELFRFMLEYDSGEPPTREVWIVTRYLGGGGWENSGHEIR